MWQLVGNQTKDLGSLAVAIKQTRRPTFDMWYLGESWWKWTWLEGRWNTTGESAETLTFGQTTKGEWIWFAAVFCCYSLCSRKWARPGRSLGSLKLPTPTHSAAADCERTHTSHRQDVNPRQRGLFNHYDEANKRSRLQYVKCQKWINQKWLAGCDLMWIAIKSISQSGKQGETKSDSAGGLKSFGALINTFDNSRNEKYFLITTSVNMLLHFNHYLVAWSLGALNFWAKHPHYVCALSSIYKNKLFPLYTDKLLH